MKILNLKLAAVIAAASMLVLTGCGQQIADKTGNNIEQTEQAAQTTEADAIDYAEAENWYKIPDITKDVDTFFIYPTVYINAAADAPAYAPMGDPMMTAGVDHVYHQQACVFEESTNLFMPYYRQANLTTEIDAFDEYGDIEKSLENLPEQDIDDALDYYFENYNEGRPFIIAGHSQGAAMTRLVLKHYFAEHPDYYERMVAAYVIGYSVTEKDLEEYPHLKFAEGADDTGVVVSWNTEGAGNKDKENCVIVDGCISINPINWKKDDTYASAEENLGSRVLNAEMGEYEIKDIGADAQLDTERGVVICNADYPFIDVSTYEGIPDIFGPESFHNGDYPFYFNNIKENVKTRIDMFMRK